MEKQHRLLSVPMLFALCGWIALAAGGCMVGPDYHPPHPDAPSGWAGVKDAASHPSVPTAQPAELTQWWKQFDDPVLTQLIEDALKTNLDVELAVARLRQARAALGIAAAPLWPAISASAEYQRKHLLPPKAWSVRRRISIRQASTQLGNSTCSAGSAATSNRPAQMSWPPPKASASRRSASLPKWRSTMFYCADISRKYRWRKRTLNLCRTRR